MGTRGYKPTSPGRRFVTGSDCAEITETRPLKKLTKGKTRSSGRNSDGHITSRHRGGGHKRRLRTLDFRRDKIDVLAVVADDRVRPRDSRDGRNAVGKPRQGY